MKFMILGFGLLLSASSFAAGSCQVAPGAPEYFQASAPSQLEAAKESSAACEDYKAKNKADGSCIIASCFPTDNFYTCRTELLVCKEDK